MILVILRQRLHLPGNWLPMLFILLVFGFKYGLGVYNAIGFMLALPRTMPAHAR